MKRIVARTTDDILAALDPGAATWDGEWRERWLFRGQDGADYPLQAKALRAEEFGGLAPPEEPKYGPPHEGGYNYLVSREHSALLRFWRAADRVGIQIPGDGQHLRHHEKYQQVVAPTLQDGTWPGPDILPALALAQHHGVPTRLLDWTYSAHTAAFFAAWNAFDNCGDGGDVGCGRQFTIWAVDGWALPRRVIPVTVPRGENRFLHAQNALFLLDTGIADDWKAGFAPRPLEQVLLDSRGRAATTTPNVVRIDAHVGLAADLLKRLQTRGLTLLSLMPTLDNVKLSNDLELAVR